MQLIKITATDMWQGRDTQRLVGLAFDLEEAIKLARQDTDAMKDVASQNGHIVFDWITVGELESEERIGATDSDEFKAQLSFPVPENWKASEAYGSYYCIEDNQIYQKPQGVNEFIASPDEFDLEGDNDIGAVDECAFAPEEEFPFIVEIQVLFDLSGEEVQKLNPISSFTNESIKQHSDEYI